MNKDKGYIFMLVMGMILLSGCTGTPAPTPPLFIIAGVRDTNSIIVLQDRVLEPNAPTPRFVRFTSQQLTATPLAFDIVDEASSRSELVVLSRGGTRDTNNIFPAFLDFFNTRGLTPTDPGTFRPSRAQIDLRTLTYPFPLADLCPIDVEVTRDGNYALIFNSPRVCNPTKLDTDNVIVVVSLRAAPVSVVSSLLQENSTKPLVTSSVLTGSPISTGMFLDQSGDTLYYLRRVGVATLELRTLSFTAYTSTTPETTTNPAQVISSNIPIRGDEFRDMTKVGSNIAILGGGSYVLAPQTVTEGFVPRATDTVDVRFQGPRAFVQDITNTRLLFLDDNERIVYHADPNTTTNTEADVTGTVSTWNTSDNFLYIAGTDRLTILDTLPFAEGSINLSSLLTEDTCQDSPDLCALDNPTALSWIQGILLPTSQP